MKMKYKLTKENKMEENKMLDDPRDLTIITPGTIECEKVLSLHHDERFVFMMKMTTTDTEEKVIATLFEVYLRTRGIEVKGRYKNSPLKGATYEERNEYDDVIRFLQARLIASCGCRWNDY